MKIITLDLSEFGGREKCMVRDILNAYLAPGKNRTKVFSGITTIAFNLYSGTVVAVDEWDFSAIVVDGELHDLFQCHECGQEGITEDFDTSTKCCSKYFKKVTES